MSSSGDVEIQVVHSVRAVEPGAWDGLSGGQGFASHRWYEFGETVLEDEKPMYVLAYRRGKPVGRASFWLTRDVPLPGVSPTLRRVLRAVLRRRPVLVCRSPLVDCSGLILPEPPLREQARAAMAGAIRERARQHRASFVVFDYLGKHEAGDWPGGFVPAIVQDPGTRLDVNWRDFDEYLRSLQATARADFRRHGRQADRTGLQTRVDSRVRCIDEALDLIGRVEAHYGSPVPWARRMLEHMGMVQGAWISVEQEGRPVAAGLYLSDGPAAALTLLGRDYQVPYAYFQLFYRAVRYAIESGVQTLRGGSGAHDFKRRLGFQVEDNNHVAFAATNPVLGWLGRRAAA